MSEVKTELITTDQFIDSQLTKFEFKKEELQALADEYSQLTIVDTEDREGYKLVHDARMTLVRKRTAIGKVVKELKDVANTFKKSVDDRGDEFINIIEPTEALLWDRETAIDREKERIRVDKQRQEDERIQTMIDQLAAVGQVADYVTIKGYSDDQFTEVLTEAINAHNEKLNREREEREANRIREEEETRVRLENEKLAAAERKKQEQENAIERERLQKIKDEQDLRDKDLREREEKVRVESQAIIDAQRKRDNDERQRQQVAQTMRETAERDRLAKIESDRLAEEARIEALNSATDPEKFGEMHLMLSSLVFGNNWPVFTSAAGSHTASRVMSNLHEAIDICKREMKDMASQPSSKRSI